MSMSINGALTGKVEGRFDLEQKPLADKLEQLREILPNPKDQETLRSLTSAPTLQAPSGGLSLDSLMQAISNEDRKLGVQSAVDDLKAQGEEIKELGDKKLEELHKQLEEMKKQEAWGIFTKVFQAIGAIFGAIASACVVAVGVATGNPLLITAGVLGAITAIDGACSVISDGEVSIAKGLEAFGTEVCGMSAEDSKLATQITMFVGGLLTFAITIASGVVAGKAAATGKGMAKAAKTAAQTSENILQSALLPAENTAKAVKIPTSVTKLGQISAGMQAVSGGTQAMTGAGSIALAAINEQIQQLEANKIDIDAVLEQLREHMAMMEEFVEHQMETCNELMSDVKDIVDNCNETASTILSASPQMA